MVHKKHVLENILELEHIIGNGAGQGTIPCATDSDYNGKIPLDLR